MSIKKLTIIFLIMALSLLADSSFAQEPIGAGILHVLGIGLTADPAQQTAPINMGTAVNTLLEYPDVDIGDIIPGIPQDFEVVAELTEKCLKNNER